MANLYEIDYQLQMLEDYMVDVETGEILGSIDLKYDDKIIVSIPLVADRTTSKSNFIISFTDKLCYNFD